MLSYRFRRRWLSEDGNGFHGPIAVYIICKKTEREASEDRAAVRGQRVPGYRNLRKRERQMNYTYLLECSDGTLYCGWTNDLEKRVNAHNSGRGAKYTKPRRPVRLVWYETFETKEEAMSREAKVKQLSRKQKEELVAQGPNNRNTGRKNL